MRNIIPYIEYETSSEEVQKEIDFQIQQNGKVTNMKKTLLHSLTAFKSYQEWYPLKEEIEKFIGSRGVILFSHAMEKKSTVDNPSTACYESTKPQTEPTPTPENKVEATPTPKPVENVQRITSSVGSGSYPEITVKNGIPVIWNLKVEQGKLNGCNNEILIPAFNIDKKLQVGDNIVEFTPQKEGVITYICWMGMIKSKIIVVNN